jgi:hypothetical protein
VSFIHSSFLFGPQPYSEFLIHANSFSERDSNFLDSMAGGYTAGV